MSTRNLSVSLVAGVHDPISAAEIADIAKAIEAAGYHKLYLTDHFFHASATFHSTSAFAVIAAATQNIPLGFCAYIAPLRHAIVAAKELAFLDGLCGGRLEPGLAAGSSKAEFDAFGIPFNTRGKRLDECIEAMKRLWTEESASFEGEHFQFSDVRLTPKPVRKPHPPIWIGSWTGPRPAARRVVKHAHGWQASALHATLEQGIEGWKRLEAMCEEMGRDPATIRRSMVNLVVCVDETREKALAGLPSTHRMHDELIAAGPPEQVAEHIRGFYDAGFEEVAVWIPVHGHEQVQRVAEEVRPLLD